MCMSFLRIHVYPVLALILVHRITLACQIHAARMNCVSMASRNIPALSDHRKHILTQLLICALLHAVTAVSAKVEHVYADLDFQETIVRMFLSEVLLTYNAKCNLWIQLHDPVVELFATQNIRK
ncbi:hypothetical protein DPMN_192019 [Dreissena polymorpha]|uniref:Uncharacterized protein n=1 Tax=Dreissena polymorpha TaxID=45954 RepID=A0A9D4B6P1_DREPO|nr:hypothetical protein DPMN_192019 [Dreissena polymorpha]